MGSLSGLVASVSPAPKGRVRYATRAESDALDAAERAADANGTGNAWRAQQARDFRAAREADRKAGIPWWRRV